MLKNLFKKSAVPAVHPDAESAFHSDNYLRHTARRLEHLASLHLEVGGRSVLDVASGIGDHAQYYLDRGCRITLSDVREENFEILRRRFPGQPIHFLDMENPEVLEGSPFEVIHCYGLLYHIGRPDVALDYLGEHCSGMLLLETCVTPGDELDIHPISEDKGNPTWAFSGNACRPTRAWIFQRLQQNFPHVYVPTTQPNHPDFPIDWTVPPERKLTRAVFVASRTPLANPQLSTELLTIQRRHP